MFWVKSGPFFVRLSLRMEGPTRPRLAMQDWQHFPYYVPAELWDKMYSQHGNSTAALVALVDHLHGLGLRCPSETTQGTICAVILLRETPAKVQAMLENFMELRTAFLNCKGRIQQVIQQRRAVAAQFPGGNYLLQLPADPRMASDEVRRKAFPPDGALIVPPRCDMDRVRLIVTQIPYRSRNHTATVLPMQHHVLQAHQAALMAAQFMANGGGAGFANTCPTLTLFPPKRKPLDDLLSRASSGSLGETSVRLALADAPGQQEQPSVAQPVQDNVAPPEASVPEQNPVQAASAQPVEEAPGEEHRPEPDHSNKQPAAMDVGRAAPVPLEHSLARMAAARAAEGKAGLVTPGTAKKPAGKKSLPKPKASLKKPSVSPAMTSKNNDKKKAKAITTSMTRVAKAELKKNILKSVPPALKKRFSNGCSKCRNVQLCTVSCWRMRGF